METVTLVLVFLDSENNEKSITIKDPKMDLSLEEVTDAMQEIIDSDAILTAAGNHLQTVSQCYYKTVTITRPEPEDGE
ncbi:MAG: DUF2922 domain-containing protein [Phascolarctobacterium sp.]|nr:DUF2922 domain-containing protein [Phascolarctobacterium sp.]